MRRPNPAAARRGARLAVVLLCAAAWAGPPAVADRPAEAPADLDRRAVERIEHPPLGLPAMPLPAHNPPTAAKVRLGRKLFLDRRLSANGSLSCAMCHVPEQGFTVNELATAVGFAGKSLPRNAPALYNAGYSRLLFHDGREPSLDLQPFDVFLNPAEMAMPSLGALVAAVARLPDYAEPFAAAFGEGGGSGQAISVQHVGDALGTYMRSLASADSPFDRWRYGGDPGALSPAARRGFALFTGRAGCARCHTVGDDSALLTDGAFHDTGIAVATDRRRRAATPVRVELAPGVFTTVERRVLATVGDPRPVDLGRFAVTQEPADRWRFRTPSLRNVALTAPYMHDGSLATLRDVVAYYDAGGAAHPGLDRRLAPLDLDAGEIDDLVAFLVSLTGSNVAELTADARSEAVGNPGG